MIGNFSLCHQVADCYSFEIGSGFWDYVSYILSFSVQIVHFLGGGDSGGDDAL